MECSVEGCSAKVYAKGMCKLHYKRQWRNGSPHVSRPCLHLPVEQKFWLYVSKKEGCWEWGGYKDKDGYGKLRVGKTNRSAHRISWELHHGEIPPSLFVLHKCNNPSCVRPDHLYVGDQFDNMRDRTVSGNAPRGESHPNCKFSSEVVSAVRSAGGTYRQISRIFGISESQVGNIKRGSQRATG